VSVAGAPLRTSQLIANLRHPRVVEARKLARGSTRRKAGRFLIEGPQAIREAANDPGRLVDLFATSDAVSEYAELIEKVAASGAPITLVSDAVLRSLAETVTPQGLVGIGRTLSVDVSVLLERRPRLLTVLAYARDPGNVGTVIRCADAAGSDGVVVSTESVDVHNGKCVRASAGSLFHLPVAADVPLAHGLSRIHDAGLTVLAADVTGQTTLDDAIEAGLLSRAIAWVFGNEAWGMPDDLRAGADEVVRVPIYGKAESLNLATAAAVCLYATARAQRRP
jgi:RNA methyltransferase, TrmH family